MEDEIVSVQHPSHNLSLCEYLSSIGFDANKFDIPLQFWFNLNSMADDEWFVLTDQMINLIGFKASESNENQRRSNMFAYIRKHFIEGLDFDKTSIVVPKTVR